MYRVEYHNIQDPKSLNLLFNSIEGAEKFMKELLNRKDVRETIEHLRNKKRLDALNYAQSEAHLYPLYGDIDDNIPTVLGLKIRVDRYGSYEYRIGTLNKKFQDGFGCILIRVSSGIDNIAKSVCSSKPNKLNILAANLSKIFSNDYSPPYHE
jgi:hypothetical protein